MVLEAWLSRVENSELSFQESYQRGRFILSFIYDFFFIKNYKMLDDVKRVIRGISKEENLRQRTFLDLKIMRMLLSWLFEPGTFLRFCKLCPKETLTFYNMLLIRYDDNLDQTMFYALGEMIVDKTRSK
jgi:hypothetical protein